MTDNIIPSIKIEEKLLLKLYSKIFYLFQKLETVELYRIFSSKK